MIEDKADEVWFHEVQGLRNALMYVFYTLLGALILMFLYADFQQLVLHKPFGEEPAPDLVLIIATLIPTVLLYIFAITKLETRITAEGVSFRWTPFQNNYTLYKWSDIISISMIEYGFVGYGIRLAKYGIVHTAGGHHGLQITLKGNKHITIGTQVAGVLKNILKEKSFYTEL